MLLESGQVAVDVAASLMVGARVSGRVSADADGRPLEGICVSAFSDETGSFGQDRTGADGSYAITTLRGGDYQVVFDDCSAPYTFLAKAYDDVPMDGGFLVGPGAEQPTPVPVADRGQAGGHRRVARRGRLGAGHGHRPAHR